MERKLIPVNLLRGPRPGFVALLWLLGMLLSLGVGTPLALRRRGKT